MRLKHVMPEWDDTDWLDEPDPDERLKGYLLSQLRLLPWIGDWAWVTDRILVISRSPVADQDPMFYHLPFEQLLPLFPADERLSFQALLDEPQAQPQKWVAYQEPDQPTFISSYDCEALVPKQAGHLMA